MAFRNAFCTAVILLATVPAVAEPLDNARRWTRAKFLGVLDDNIAPAHLVRALRPPHFQAA
jgi:hypothetical protein